MAENRAYDEALDLMNRGEHHAAIEVYRRALEQEPLRARIHTNLAVAMSRSGHPREALELANRGCELAPDDPYPRVMRAEIHGELELHDQALADAECARQLARTAGDELNLDIALSHLGWALVQLDRGREAEGVAREILGRTPEDTGGYAMLAGALADMDRWGEALEALESALRLDPEAEWLQERRELCVTALRHLMPALDDLEQSIGPDSSWEDWHALGCTRFMFGRLEEAATAFDEAHLRHPDGDRRAEAAMLSPQEADCRLRLIARR